MAKRNLPIVYATPNHSMQEIIVSLNSGSDNNHQTAAKLLTLNSQKSFYVALLYILLTFVLI
jgi:hypothetical protein